MLYSANLAQAELGAAARVRFAEKATAQLKRLERLIQDVLLFARGERIGRDRVSLRELFGEATQSVEALFREQGVSFRVLGATGEAGAAVIVGSRKALAGALVNLLENALQACSAGGDVTLAGEWQAGQVAISVRDSGAGIAPEIQGRIFEPFFTTRGQGTGLGLAIALAVVRSHGGTMQLRSVLGHGCEFVIALPSSPAGEAIDSTDESDGT